MLMFLTNESFLNLFKGEKKLQRLFQGWYNIAQFGLVCCFNRDPSLTWQAIPKSRVTFVTVTSSVKKSSRLSGRIKDLDFTMRLFLKCFFYHLLIYIKLYFYLFSAWLLQWTVLWYHPGLPPSSLVGTKYCCLTYCFDVEPCWSLPGHSLCQRVIRIFHTFLYTVALWQLGQLCSSCQLHKTSSPWLLNDFQMGGKSHKQSCNTCQVYCALNTICQRERE